MKAMDKFVQKKRSKVAIGLGAAATLCFSMAGCGSAPVDGAGSGQSTEKAGRVSEQLSAYSWDYEYYSDATYTTLVGFWGGSCGGGTDKWGQRTKYVIGDRENCKSGVSIGCYEYIDGVEYCGETSCVIC